MEEKEFDRRFKQAKKNRIIFLLRLLVLILMGSMVGSLITNFIIIWIKSN